MHISPKDYTVVKAILREYVAGQEVWAFGSRVHGHNLKPFSDLDLVIVADHTIGLDRYAALKHAFSQSDLPFRVDVVEWCNLDDGFKKLIQASYEVVKGKNSS